MSQIPKIDIASRSHSQSIPFLVFLIFDIDFPATMRLWFRFFLLPHYRFKHQGPKLSLFVVFAHKIEVYLLDVREMETKWATQRTTIIGSFLSHFPIRSAHLAFHFPSYLPNARLQLIVGNKRYLQSNGFIFHSGFRHSYGFRFI